MGLRKAADSAPLRAVRLQVPLPDRGIQVADEYTLEPTADDLRGARPIGEGAYIDAQPAAVVAQRLAGLRLDGGIYQIGVPDYPARKERKLHPLTSHL